MRTNVTILLAVFLISLQAWAQNYIEPLRVKEGFTSKYIFQPAEMINMLVAGGFRGLAVDLLWVRVDQYNHHGQWYKLLPLFRMITFLQPNFILAWSVGGWHMAFNLYYSGKSPEEKSKWLQAGIRFLKEGIQNNPDRYELYFELGWTYYFKVNDYPSAIRYLKRAVRFRHPQFVDHVLAHAYEKNGDLNSALDIWKALQNKPDREIPMDSIVNRSVLKLSEAIKSTSSSRAKNPNQ